MAYPFGFLLWVMLMLLVGGRLRNFRLQHINCRLRMSKARDWRPDPSLPKPSCNCLGSMDKYLWPFRLVSSVVVHKINAGYLHQVPLTFCLEFSILYTNTGFLQPWDGQVPLTFQLVSSMVWHKYRPSPARTRWTCTFDLLFGIFNGYFDGLKHKPTISVSDRR